MINDPLHTCPKCGCSMGEGRQVAESTMGEVVGHDFTCPKCEFSKMTYVEDAYDFQVLTSEGEITFPFRD